MRWPCRIVRLVMFLPLRCCEMGLGVGRSSFIFGLYGSADRYQRKRARDVNMRGISSACLTVQQGITSTYIQREVAETVSPFDTQLNRNTGLATIHFTFFFQDRPTRNNPPVRSALRQVVQCQLLVPSPGNRTGIWGISAVVVPPWSHVLESIRLLNKTPMSPKEAKEVKERERI
jgi:hypothetical protein